ncbi:family 16 glycoside hydrolase [Maioricimonas sp. JC845]|uniref:3-keto-disaccharide hydrolase n=1 Tax=Maioricimonas sp. JC845 TaxID=3232138 RepID=UPI00345998C6
MILSSARRATTFAGLAIIMTGSLTAFSALVDEWKSGLDWPEPVVVDPGPVGGPPSDAIVLFDGTDLSQWKGGENWTLEDGYGICGGTITSKQAFGDCQLHVEFASPSEVESSGQGRGNSGIYLMGRYELQILDSYENGTYFDGQCGSIYKQRPPMVNACRPPGEWQTYDIIFKGPRFGEDGALTSPATITVLQNGVLIQDHFELQGGTSYYRPPEYTAHGPRAPLSIQYHNDAVRFRNIWIRDLMPESGDGTARMQE